MDAARGDSSPKVTTFVDAFFDMEAYDDFLLDLVQSTPEKQKREAGRQPARYGQAPAPGQSMSGRTSQPMTPGSTLARVIQPYELSMVPVEDWKPGQQVTLGSIIGTHFRARSTRRLRFEHKLWNGLCLTKHYPDLIDVIGVTWESKDIIRVDRVVFGSLLGLTRPTAALFNPQGSFQSHGFQEVNIDESITEFQNVRFFRHRSGEFTRDSTREDLIRCKWIVRKLQMQQRADAE